MNKTLLFCCLFCTTWLSAQRQYHIDHYLLDMRIADGFEFIELTQSVHIQFTDTCSVLQLDLGGPLDNGLGIKVQKVVAPHQALIWQQNTEELLISLSKVFQKGETLTLGIELKGKPRDGLIISENKYKEPTIFADNWPNRAHYWYACKDHPSNKATYTFMVEAPQTYEVVANGILVSKTLVKERNSMVWNFSVKEPIPTKVAVVGIADFASRRYAASNDISMQGFAYPQDSIRALASFEVAPTILEFYQTLVGPYPFAELNHVQSTTRYGGMENAGCIFYDENSLNANLNSTHLIAHEVAHQWFGNSVTEADWQHLWLSEGFATYLTNMYIEQSEGQKAFQQQLHKDRIRVFNLYNQGFHQALVDSLTPNLLDRLNANAYQKGAWVLHMLRSQIGDSLFMVGLQQFYTRYQYQNATSQDFAKLLDSICPQNLAPFFKQWFYQVGHPQLKTHLFQKKGTWYLEITQKQEALFSFPLQISISSDGGPTQLLEFEVAKRKEVFEIPDALIGIDVQLMMDPNMNLLYEPIY